MDNVHKFKLIIEKFTLILKLTTLSCYAELKLSIVVSGYER